MRRSWRGGYEAITSSRCTTEKRAHECGRTCAVVYEHPQGGLIVRRMRVQDFADAPHIPARQAKWHHRAISSFFYS